MRKIFNKLFGRKKRVLVVYLNVSKYSKDFASAHIQKTGEDFKNLLGDDYKIIVLEAEGDTRIEMLPF